MSQQLQYCVIIGGAGAVGNMFVTLLTSIGAEVCVVDTRPSEAAAQFECGDITMPSPRILSILKMADLVLFAVPERVALAAIEPVAAVMKSEALLAHTLSVQSQAAAVVRSVKLHVEAVGLNPMFAPTLSIAGRPVAAVVLNEGPRVRELLQLITSWGGRVVRLNAEEHDQISAATQVLTHATILAFGLALADLNLDITLLSTLAPPPYATLLALLARIVSGAPEVYWDIQSANPQAAVVRAALASSIDRLRAATQDETKFLSMLQKAHETLGCEVELYRVICTRIFDGPLSLPIHSLQENI